MRKEASQYHETLIDTDRVICEKLFAIICRELPAAEFKIWHSHPVWFIDGNPVAGYSKLKEGIQLLFWSGQSFEEEKLKKEGKFKAAGIRYSDVAQLDATDLKRWLKKAETIQWDYKNIVKRKGELLRLK